MLQNISIVELIYVTNQSDYSHANSYILNYIIFINFEINQISYIKEWVTVEWNIMKWVYQWLTSFPNGQHSIESNGRSSVTYRGYRR